MLIEEVTEENIKDVEDSELRNLMLRCALIWRSRIGDKHGKANQSKTDES